MGLSGYVLRAARFGPANDPASSTPQQGVEMDARPLPGSYQLIGPDVVDIAAQTYTAAVLLNPDEGQQEWLVWPATTSHFALVADSTWTTTEGTGVYAPGVLAVTGAGGPWADGTSSVFVKDNAGRSFGGVTSVKVRRGDDGVVVTAAAFTSTNTATGEVVLTGATLTSLGGGVSLARGDEITEVTYWLDIPRFWWTRNDPEATRFGWDGRAQRWAPLKGRAPVLLGVLSTTQATDFRLNPVPANLAVGSYLPGNTTPDRYSMVRVGADPGATSYPLAPEVQGSFLGVLTVEDEDVTGYDFTALNPAPAAVVGVTTGEIVWNPDFLADHENTTAWYVPRDFQAGATGDLGVATAASFLAPPPRPDETPLLRISTGRYLTARVVDTDAALAALVLVEGEVGVSAGTGKIRLAQTDLDKCTPGEATFNKLLYGAHLWYDGVALTAIPVPVTPPAKVVDHTGTPTTVTASGQLYVPDSISAPGLGVFGVLRPPDGTGALPDVGTPSTRPGATGLVRDLGTVGELLVFGRAGAFETVRTVRTDSELPVEAAVPAGEVWVSRQAGPGGSRVYVGRGDRTRFSGQALYVGRATVTPARYEAQAKIVSRRRFDTITLDGTEELYVHANGQAKGWTATAGTFTIDEIATSINAALAPDATAKARNGHLIIEALSLSTGYLEIGFGPSGSVALDGPAKLGFMPGWRVDPAAGHVWLQDSGVRFGFERSPQNLDRTGTTPDVRATSFRSGDLAGQVGPLPLHLLDSTPAWDLPGYAPGVFFRAHRGANVTDLDHYGKVRYELEAGTMRYLKAGEASGTFDKPRDYVWVGEAGLIPESLVEELGGQLEVAEAGGVFQTALSTEYGVNGAGVVNLHTPVGALQLSGVTGQTFEGFPQLIDSTMDFVAAGVVPGYRLKVTRGADAGSYEVVEVAAQSLTVTPDFTVSAQDLTWELYEGSWGDDTSVWVDATYRELPFLEDDTVQIRLLSELGVVGSGLHTALVREAISSGRGLAVRFGLEGATATATLLTRTVLGILANGLEVPTARITSSAFSLLIGSREFTHGSSTLVLVGNILDPVPTGLVHYDAAGVLKFATDLLADLEGEKVIYVERPVLSNGSLESEMAEIDPETGTTAYAPADSALHASETAYLVETLVLTGRVDATLHPGNGTFVLARPAREGQIVEVAYTVADATGTSTGVAKTEFLPVFVRREAVTQVSDNIYGFAADGRTIYTASTPRVYVGGAPVRSAEINTVERLIGFPTAPTGTVTVSYAVLEAAGGETTYTVSTPPVYRPSLLVPAWSPTLVLPGIRSEIQPGCLVRVGPAAAYVKAVSLGAESTTVTLYPTPTKDLGSRVPGKDVPLLVTSGPCVDVVDGVVAPTNDSPALFATLASYTAAPRGAQAVAVAGDARRYGVAGHVLEVGGHPYVVAGSALASDGQSTLIALATPTRQTYTTEVLRVSRRPIYPPSASLVLGAGPVASVADAEVIRFAADGRGMTLARGTDYELDGATGNLHLTASLVAGEKIKVTHNRPRTLGPVVANGVELQPRWRATYRVEGVEPTLTGADLRASYFYRHPDSFYVAATPLGDLLDAILTDQEVANYTVTPALTRQTARPDRQGGLGAWGTAWESGNRDHVARMVLGLLNDVVAALEQIQETADGRVVGSRSGRFRHAVKSASPPPPGWVNPVTGRLNPRDLWAYVFLLERQGSPLWPLRDDPVVEPLTAAVAGDTLTGTTPDPDRLAALQDTQRNGVRNDIDDLALTGTRDTTAYLAGAFPFIRTYGRYTVLGMPSSWSRLYPERTKVFGTTYPGIGADVTTSDPGVYTDNTTASTFNKVVGVLRNPVLGAVRSVTDLSLVDRAARGRVEGYETNGYGSVNLQAANRPAALLSVLNPGEFPVDSSGLPDTTQLISQSGDLADLTTGNPDLSTPAWVAFDSGERHRLAVGRPDGTIDLLGFSGSLAAVDGGAELRPVYVDKILDGCVVTFCWDDGTSTGSPILDHTQILVVGVTAPEGEVLGMSPGDTLLPQRIAPAADALPQYREGTDFGLRPLTGELVDLTSSTVAGQHPLTPLLNYEGQVGYPNVSTTPATIPALRGEPEADDGDDSTPYAAVLPSETDTLRAAATHLGGLLHDDDIAAAGALYPDELLAEDGAVLAAASGVNHPATLLSSRHLQPVTQAGGYVAGTGVGDAAEHDLVLVEYADGAAKGWQGWHEVGKISLGGSDGVVSQLDFPRFTTQSGKGDRCRYVFDNAVVHVSDGSSGVNITEVGGETVFDFSSVVGLYLNDGQVGLNGGFNSLVDHTSNAYPNTNLIQIALYHGTTGALLETVELQGASASGGAAPGGLALGSRPTFNTSVLRVPVLGFVTTLGQTVSFSISVDTATDAAAGSYTGWVDADRVTFHECFDLRHIGARGETTQGAVSVEGQLDVRYVTGATDQISCNSAAEINAGVPLTFLARPTGTWFTTAAVSGDGTEDGKAQVMSFEKRGANPSFDQGDVVFRVLPSTDQNAAGDICQGTGYADGPGTTGAYRLEDLVITSGSVANIEPGDLLVIRRAAGAAYATTKAGTYAVRHAVAPDPAVDYKAATLQATTGTGAGFAPLRYPRVVEYSTVANTLEVETDATTMALFPAAGTVVVVLNLSYLGNPGAAGAADGLAALADYTSKNGFVFEGLNNWRNAQGTALTEGVFAARAVAGLMVAGHLTVPLSFTGASGLPDYQVVGYEAGGVAKHGFAYLTVHHPLNTVTNRVFAVADFVSQSAMPTAAKIGVEVSAGTDTDAYVPDPSTLVYDGIPTQLDISEVAAVDWEAIYDSTATGVFQDIECLLPGTVLLTSNNVGGAAGFYAQAGVYIEPSWPRPVPDLGTAYPHMVDASFSLAQAERGFRPGPALGAPSPENVQFEVRRVRRFSQPLQGLAREIGSLQDRYELRRGSVSLYAATGAFGTVTVTDSAAGAYTAAGIRAGDTFRLLDAGELIEEREIVAVLSATELLLSPPGILAINPVGMEFEIWVNAAPVPVEQSCAQLLEALADSIVYRSAPNYTTNAGGYVTTTNQLRDTAVASFLTTGVEVGDLIVVDPADLLRPADQPAYPEYGAGPRGDTGVVTRVEYAAGAPSALDDNRGVYRVSSVQAAYLGVDPVTGFAGSTQTDVLLGAVGEEYAVYPTVQASTLTQDGREGQNDLRVTAYAAAKSFKASAASVAPFGYVVVRPSSLFGNSSLDLALMLRERFLTWLDLLRPFFTGYGHGSYAALQGGGHFTDLGRSGAPASGRGVLDNAYGGDLEGEVGTAPYLNNRHGLSLLDRRFWLGDTRLDDETPSGNPTPYADLGNGVGRPVQPDRITGVLDQGDRFRKVRNAWVEFRTDRVDGSLQQEQRLWEETTKPKKSARTALLKKTTP